MRSPLLVMLCMVSLLHLAVPTYGTGFLEGIEKAAALNLRSSLRRPFALGPWSCATN